MCNRSAHGKKGAQNDIAAYPLDGTQQERLRSVHSLFKAFDQFRPRCVRRFALRLRFASFALRLGDETKSVTVVLQPRVRADADEKTERTAALHS